MNERSRRSSPLDRELTIFLRLIDELPDGYRPLAHPSELAERGGWPPAFTQALFDSARGRRFLAPYQPKRNVTRWRVSPQGHAWLGDRNDDHATQ